MSYEPEHQQRRKAEVVHRAPQRHQHDRCPQHVYPGDIVRCRCGRLGKVVSGDYAYNVRWWGSQRRRARKIASQP